MPHRRTPLISPADAELLAQAKAQQQRRQTSLAKLTHRERALAELLTTGMSNAQLAQRLGCTERTVKAHIVNMRDKCGGDNRLQLVLILCGLI